MRRFVTLAVIAGALSAFAQGGQRLRDRDPDLQSAKGIAAELDQANFHYGPFYFLSRFRISDLGYTQQGYTLTDSSDGGLNLSVEAPQRLYFTPHKKVILTAEAVPGYSFFGDSFGDGQFNYSLRGDAHFLFNHLYLDLYTTRSDTIRPHVADINRLVTQRADEYGVSGEMKYSSRTSALFSIRYEDIEFPGDRFQPASPIDVALLNRVERNGRVALHHKTFPLTSLFVAAEMSNYGFRRATYKDSTRRWLGAGFTRDSGRTSLRVEAGPATLDFEDPTQRDYSEVIGMATINRSKSRWNYGAGVERDVGFSIFADNNYFIASIANANVSYVATRRLTLRTGASYERDDYDVPVGGLIRKDTIEFYRIGFLYNFRRFQTGVDVGWYERQSNFSDRDAGIRWLFYLSFSPTV
ncbi:MAG TPA: hypothetical protein VNA69_12260 [Thermoanaerobaculia bacterium]|nr:hypothetical protein [Thermoanaerobaculia bacterium]